MPSANLGFGLWCLLFALWCGVYCSVCGVVFTVRAVVWCLLFGLWCLLFALWCLLLPGHRAVGIGLWCFLFVLIRQGGLCKTISVSNSPNVMRVKRLELRGSRASDVGLFCWALSKGSFLGSFRDFRVPYRFNLMSTLHRPRCIFPANSCWSGSSFAPAVTIVVSVVVVVVTVTTITNSCWSGSSLAPATYRVEG